MRTWDKIIHGTHRRGENVIYHRCRYLLLPSNALWTENVETTYQRLVNLVFEAQIGNTMEVYMDDMLVKSLQADLHIRHLKETF